ncbi:hypothetical protein [Streptomyces sp. NBC_00273]|uniref:hypothetical protein n=1 Tax=Streptomyces sp. NBC_00273 TaxID=2903644 RepID=UPI002E29C571|nr:hypothetical protein [Streptomyces sp. NBC_00273]
MKRTVLLLIMEDVPVTSNNMPELETVEVAQPQWVMAVDDQLIEELVVWAQAEGLLRDEPHHIARAPPRERLQQRGLARLRCHPMAVTCSRCSSWCAEPRGSSPSGTASPRRSSRSRSSPWAYACLWWNAAEEKFDVILRPGVDEGNPHIAETLERCS